MASKFSLAFVASLICLLATVRAGSMSKEEIAIQSSKYEKYGALILEYDDTREGYGSYLQDATNEEFCDLENIIPGSDDWVGDSCNETAYR